MAVAYSLYIESSVISGSHSASLAVQNYLWSFEHVSSEGLAPLDPRTTATVT